MASNEYIKSGKPDLLTGRVITPIFKEIKDGKSCTIALFAKGARRKMAGWMIRNRIDQPDELTEFNIDQYKYVAKESTADKLVLLVPNHQYENATI